jgi:hypothetical protein
MEQTKLGLSFTGSVGARRAGTWHAPQRAVPGVGTWHGLVHGVPKSCQKNSNANKQRFEILEFLRFEIDYFEALLAFNHANVPFRR